MAAIPGTSLPGINPSVSQKVAFTGTSAQSAAFQSSTQVIQVVATAACFLAFGSSPTAVADTSLYLPPNVPMFIGVSGGMKVAAIQSVGAGNLFITEGA